MGRPAPRLKPTSTIQDTKRWRIQGFCLVAHMSTQSYQILRLVTKIAKSQSCNSMRDLGESLSLAPVCESAISHVGASYLIPAINPSRPADQPQQLN